MKPSFIIRLADGRYWVEIGKPPTSDPRQALRFVSRWDALTECGRAGNGLAGAAIVAYAPQAAPGGAAGATPAQN